MIGVVDSDASGLVVAPVERDELRPGTAIGHYEIVERIARDDVCTVYAARDARLGRRIAIKILRPRLARDPHAERALVRGAQAAARIAAPNVLAVYDAGTFEGSVFLATELVDGDLLERWLARPRRWRATVGVFLQAARGLEAAHAAHLVHGDLGPSKVLVGDDGRVRLLDLGLAGLTDGRPAEGEPSGEALHRAPEQLRGEGADARSDQYAWAAGLADALSRGPALANRPPRWLGAVVQRGLAPGPSDRFPSMGAAIQAVERGLRRSRRRAVAAAVGLAVAVAAAAAFVGYLGGRDEPFGRCAEPGLAPWTSERRGELAAAFAATGVPRAPAAWRSAEAAIDRYAGLWSGQRREACLARVVHEASPADHERRVSCLERRRLMFEAIVDRIDRPDRALVDQLPKLVGSLPDLEVCVRANAPEWPTDPGVRRRLTALLRDLARLSSLIDAGKLDDASRASGPILREAEQLGFPAWQAEAGYLAGRLAARRGVYDEAVRRIEQALWTAEATRHDELVVAAATDLLDIMGTKQRRPMAAEEFVEHARAAAERVGSVAARRRAARAIGRVELALGKHDAAEAELRRAAELDRTGFPADPVEEAETLNDLSTLATRRGRFAEAEPLRVRALALIEAELGPLHPRVAALAYGHALTLRGLGRTAEAQAELERSLHVYEEALGPNHPDLVQVLDALSESAIELGDLARARAYAERGVAVAEKSMAPDHPMIFTSLATLGEAMRLDGDLAGAERIQRRVLETLRKQLPRGHHATVQILLDLSVILLARGDASAAAPLCDEALDGATAIGDDTNLVLAQALACRGQVDVATGHPARAIPRLERAIAILEEAPDRFNRGSKPYEIAWVRFLLATARPATGIPIARASREVLAGRPVLYRHELGQIDDWLRRRTR